MWQDWVFTVGGLALTVSLLPMLRGQFKPPLKTAATMATVLTGFAIAQISFATYGGAALSLAQVGVWITLGVQRWKAG